MPQTATSTRSPSSRRSCHSSPRSSASSNGIPRTPKARRCVNNSTVTLSPRLVRAIVAVTLSLSFLSCVLAAAVPIAPTVVDVPTPADRPLDGFAVWVETSADALTSEGDGGEDGMSADALVSPESSKDGVPVNASPSRAFLPSFPTPGGSDQPAPHYLLANAVADFFITVAYMSIPM
ncbi:hypothetical protein HK101_007517, partial [Irineochytrium annulatum]